MLENFPRTLLEFEERFSSEAACIGYLRKGRWPDGFICPGCTGTKSWSVRGGRLDECAACGRQTSVTAGTIFHGTRKPLRVWFRAIALMLTSKQGCSATEIERAFGLAHETAWTWTHKLRCLMEPSENKLKGRVEVDESYIGGEDIAAHKGRSLAGKKVCVVAAVEDHGDTMGRARIELVANTATQSLKDFVKRTVEDGSTLHTDGLAQYRAVAQEGYSHEPDVLRDPKQASKKLPHVHRVFSLLQRVLLGTYQGGVQPKHLKAYLDEFVFRFNRRTSGSRFLLVERLLSRVFDTRVTYAEIVGADDLLPLGVT